MTRGLPPLPAPTPEDFAAATVLVDNWFEADGILPGFRRDNREALIQHRAEMIRNERMRSIRAVEEMATLTKDLGRPSATCFHAPHGAASRLRPTGFNQAQGSGR